MLCCLTAPAWARELKIEKYFDPIKKRYVEVASGEIIVKYKAGIRAQRLSGKVIKKSLEQLRRDPNVEYAEPNYIVHAFTTTPNDPNYSWQWGLPQIKADQGWDIEKGTNEVVIAVIDTGVDLIHPDLQDKLVPLADRWNFVEGNAVPNDGFGHGTHVAGIAAALTDNSLGVAGLAWNCRIMPVRVLNNSGTGTVADVNSGIRWAADHGAQVLNLSLGGPDLASSENEAVQYAHGKGCVIIAAAGNDGNTTLAYPASFDNVISVAAVDRLDARATYSNHNAYVDVAAPGGANNGTAADNIYSTYTGEGYAYDAGTSMATPFVAGLAGLILSHFSSYTNTQVENRIISTVNDLGDAGRDDYFGYGRINAYQALLDSAPTQDVTVSDLTSGVSILFPLGSITVDPVVRFEAIAAPSTSASYPLGKVLCGSAVEITSNVTSFSAPLTMTLTLPAASVAPRPYWWDAASGQWSTSGLTFVSWSGTTLTFTSTHLSIFAAFGVSGVLSDILIYPNPFKVGGGGSLTFAGLSGVETVRIFDLTGQLVYSAAAGGSSSIVWDGKNSAGHNCVPGIYLYLITDTAGNRRSGKLALSR